MRSESHFFSSNNFPKPCLFRAFVLCTILVLAGSSHGCKPAQKAQKEQYYAAALDDLVHRYSANTFGEEHWVINLSKANSSNKAYYDLHIMAGTAPTVSQLRVRFPSMALETNELKPGSRDSLHFPLPQLTWYRLGEQAQWEAFSLDRQAHCRLVRERYEGGGMSLRLSISRAKLVLAEEEREMTLEDFKALFYLAANQLP